MSKSGEQSEIAYLLKLGDGRCWQFVAGPDANSWVEEFCRIIKLKSCDQDRHRQYPRMLFLRRAAEEQEQPTLRIGSKIGGQLPQSGWKAHDFHSLRLWSHRAVPDVICEIGNEGNPILDIIRMWNSLDIIYLRLQRSQGLLLHAALVEREGKGILFVGPGGSGKSTLCRRLPHPWSALSDDQTLIVCDGRKSYLAHPTPTWSDYLLRRSKRTWNVEYHIRLAAIFFIEQARIDKVFPIGQGKTAAFISNSSTDACRRIWNNFKNPQKREFKKKMFDNACQLARAVPAYILHISPNGRFWEEIQKVL